MCILQTRIKYKGWTPWNWALDMKDRTRRLEHEVICVFIMYTHRVMVIEMQKWLIFCIFYWWQQKGSHSHISLSMNQNLNECCIKIKSQRIPWNLLYEYKGKELFYESSSVLLRDLFYVSFYTSFLTKFSSITLFLFHYLW